MAPNLILNQDENRLWQQFIFVSHLQPNQQRRSYQVREQQNIFTHRNAFTQEKKDTYVNNKH